MIRKVDLRLIFALAGGVVHVTEISMLNYFNTVTALFLGWLILDEIITIDILIATVLIIIGVFITNYKGKKAQL